MRFSENCRFTLLKPSLSFTPLYDFPHSFSVNYFNSSQEEMDSCCHLQHRELHGY